jgi:hypothetical protein
VAVTVLAVETERNLLLYGTQIIDGIAAGPGARVLLTAQANTADNGVWTVQHGGWTRPTDFFTREADIKVETTVQLGSAHTGTVWNDQIVDQMMRELEAEIKKQAVPQSAQTVQSARMKPLEPTGVVDRVTVPEFEKVQQAAATGSLQVLDLTTQVDGSRVEFLLDTMLQNKTVILTLNGLVQKQGDDGDYLLLPEEGQLLFFFAPEIEDTVLLYYV